MTDAPADRHRPLWADGLLLVIGAAMVAGLVWLGTWQVQRLGWKTDLIGAVNERAYGEPTQLPLRFFDPSQHAYLRVEATGEFEYADSQSVKAVTDLGPGRWVMTPLKTDWGRIWVNRGFVPSGQGDETLDQPEGDIRITGLLRKTEPKGSPLEKNRPEDRKWFSRDVAVMSETIGVSAKLTHFIDADHIGEPTAWPRGGLTVIKFSNNHLSYAITWYGLALMVLAAMVFITKGAWQARQTKRYSSPSLS
ncbi:MAG: SURF1 family protein [Pseudomonadota bacterium]